jgi:carboxyl-terminal processing protease
MTARGPEHDPLDPPTDDVPAVPAGLSVEPADVPTEAADLPAPPSPPARRGVGALPLALAAVAVLAGAALFLSGYMLGTRTATTPGTPAADAALFAPFWDTWDSITRSYVGPVDQKTIVEGAIDGMIKALGDPYSAYMSPAALQGARDSLAGQFEGIGAVVTARSSAAAGGACAPLGPACRMTVVSTIAASPAEGAGLSADDAITAIDGSAVDGLTLDQAIAKIRGPKGTPVTLTVARAGQPPFDLRIVRGTISQPQVEARDLENGTVRYIRVTTFSDSAATDFIAALQAGLAKGERSVIVDLRDNPGGYVTAARTIASQFISNGPIFWEQSADGTQIETAAAPGGIATDPAIRVMVLVNKGSASASEIVAGALQDTKRGTLVGQTTFGKGTIQQWVDLTDDSGGFRLTIAKWLTPAKRWIHMKGLTPDILVASGGAPTTPTGDPYIDAALKALGAPTALEAWPRAA